MPILRHYSSGGPVSVRSDVWIHGSDDETGHLNLMNMYKKLLLLASALLAGSTLLADGPQDMFCWHLRQSETCQSIAFENEARSHYRVRFTDF